MPLVLNEEQRFLQDSAREFLASNAPVKSLRTLRDSKDATGYETDLWQQMAELGSASDLVLLGWALLWRKPAERSPPLHCLPPR